MKPIIDIPNKADQKGKNEPDPRSNDRKGSTGANGTLGGTFLPARWEQSVRHMKSRNGRTVPPPPYSGSKALPGTTSQGKPQLLERPVGEGIFSALLSRSFTHADDQGGP